MFLEFSRYPDNTGHVTKPFSHLPFPWSAEECSSGRCACCVFTPALVHLWKRLLLFIRRTSGCMEPQQDQTHRIKSQWPILVVKRAACGIIV